MRFATKAIRVGQEPDPQYRAVIPPIYQSTTFAWDDLDHIPPIDYTRCANPSRLTLEAVIASLENAAYCTCFGSGMASIVAAVSLLKSGDHLLVASDIYGGTHRIAEKLLPRQGIEATYFDASQPSSIPSQVRANTRMLIFESPTNPNLRIMDIEAVCAEAKRAGIVSVFDNTFASPALQNPLNLGCDIVVHSTTKYIGGHSDVVGGALATNDQAMASEVYEWTKAVGPIPSPFDCWLTLRGVKTLSIRMDRHCSNAQKIAEHLESHPKVARVHYPGLASHPDHELAKRQMRGFGGMVSFEVAGAEQGARRFAESVSVFLLAESLGGVESLVGYPPLMSHAGMTPQERLDRGIPPTMLRLSIGIEDPDDLIEDLDQALAQV